MGMFYKKIREYYDYIFPLNIKQVEYVMGFFENESKVLEVGCANGKLTNALDKLEMTGIDLEEEFIEIAQERYPCNNYMALDMCQIKCLNQSFDGIVCFGNTLVHINNKFAVEFIDNAYAMLNAGGKLLLQIVNYDKIFTEKLHELPLIDNDNIKFERSYNYDDKFIFGAKLTVKKEDITVESEVELYPILYDDLVEMLKKSGFINIECYGDFELNSYDTTSNALVIKAEKK